MFSKRKKSPQKPENPLLKTKEPDELTINTYMNALVLLFMKFTKLQNGHQKNSSKPETLALFSNKSDSSVRRT